MKNDACMGDCAPITDNLYIGKTQNENGLVFDLTIHGKITNRCDLIKTIKELYKIEDDYGFVEDYENFVKSTMCENGTDDIIDKTFNETIKNTENKPLKDYAVLSELEDLKHRLEKLTEHVMGDEAKDKKNKPQDEAVISKQNELRETQDKAEKIQNELTELLKKREIKKNPTPFVLMELEKQNAYKKCCEKREDGKEILNRTKFHEMISDAIKKVHEE